MNASINAITLRNVCFATTAMLIAGPDFSRSVASRVIKIDWLIVPS
jgi:hypothetical protein